MYIMAQTRSQRAAALAKRRLYRKRVKNSTCRGAKQYKCARKAQCKFTKGKKRTYCRKTKNTTLKK